MIQIENGQFYYDLFYQIAFVVVLLIYFAEGFRRSFPLTSWLLVIITVRLFFIAGTKLGTITPDDLQYLTQNFQLPPIASKNMIGGFVFGILGIVFAKWALRIQYPILDAFALAVPFSMAIQRVGCLMVGCCFGTETNLPFGIQYGIEAPAFQHQFLANRLSTADHLSLSVHPVPVYIILYCLITVALLWKFRHYWKRPGNLALMSLALLMLGRFIVEFFRDPLSNGVALGTTVVGLKVVQIIVLGAFLLLVCALFLREKNYQPTYFSKAENHPLHNASYLLFLTIFLMTIRNWLTAVEFKVLLFVLIPAAIGVVWNLLKHYYSLRVRVSTMAILAIAFVLMGQKTPDKEKYQTIKFGISQGQYQTYHSIGQGSGCDRISESQEFRQKYFMAGVGYSQTEIKENTQLEYGLNGYLGQQLEYGQINNYEDKTLLFGINPYVNYDLKWIGIGGGLHIGNLSFTMDTWNEDGTPEVPETGSQKTPIFPQFHCRLGPQRFLFIDYKFADHFPSPFPGLEHQFELGTGFGLKNGTNFRIGASPENSAFIGAYIPISNQLVFEPYYLWNNGSNELVSNPYQLSFSIHYRFGHSR